MHNLFTSLSICGVATLLLAGPGYGQAPTNDNKVYLPLISVVVDASEPLAWQEETDELSEELQQALGARFGGVWIDQNDGGRIKVGIRGDAVAIQATTDQFGLTALTDVVPVQHDFDWLYAASEWLGNAVVDVNQAASFPLESGLLPAQNAVYLRLPRGKELTAAQQTLIDEAKNRYGAALLIDTYDELATAAACIRGSGLYCDSPLRAGVVIHNSSHTKICTVGFIAKSKIDSKLYVFTAGHCYANRQEIWHTHFANGELHNIGPFHNYRRDSEGDYGIIRIANVAGWNPKPWVFVNITANTTYDDDYWIARDSTTPVGTRVCNTGALKPDLTSCGFVEAINQSVPILYQDGIITVKHLARANFCAIPGDSGGPVYSYHVARGILVAILSNRTQGCISYYQGVRAAEQGMNVNIIHHTP